MLVECHVLETNDPHPRPRLRQASFEYEGGGMKRVADEHRYWEFGLLEPEVRHSRT
jgi:hypothetical protein